VGPPPWTEGWGRLEAKTHAAPVSKGTPVKIPEPEGWTECHSMLVLRVGALAVEGGAGGGVKLISLLSHRG